MLKKIIFVATALFYACIAVAWGQLRISAPDAEIEYGENPLKSYVLHGSLNSSNTQSLEITVSYDASVIYVHKIVGASAYALKCSEMPFDVDYSDPENAILTFSCDNLGSVGDGVICEFLIEGLVGEDSTTIFKIVQVKSGGEPVADFEFEDGSVKVNGPSVIQTEKEGLRQNYPNPFEVSTVVPFYILKPTKIDIKMFNMFGEKARDLSSGTGTSRALVFDNEGKIIENPGERVFERGSYELKIIPDRNSFASGAYFLVMVTDESVYRTKILFVK